MDPLLTTIIIIALAILLFLSNRLRPDVVAILTVLALGLGGVLTSAEVFSGFSRSAVMVIIAIFIIAEGLRRTGITDRMGAMLVRIGGRREGSLVLTVTLAGALLSLFMNNIAAASVLLPAISGAARKTGVPASRLLMPLAFGTILGGMATLLTTVNILASGMLRQQGLEGFGLLDFLPVGGVVALVGALYMTLLGRHLLPGHARVERERGAADEPSLQGVYALEERLVRGRIFTGSPLDGQTVRQSQLRERFQLNLIAIQRKGRLMDTIAAGMVMHKDDVLFFIGRLDKIPVAELEKEVTLLSECTMPGMAMMEAVLPPRSRLIGQTLRQAKFGEKYGLNVLAIWRGGRPIRTGHAELRLAFGDALLLQGASERIDLLHAEPDLLPVTGQQRPVETWKAVAATLILLAVLVCGGLEIFPLAETFLAGALLMVLLRVLDMDSAYHAVEWKSVFLVAGILPLGTALVKSGAAEMISSGLMQLFGGSSDLLVGASLLGLTILLTQMMNGAAVAAIMVPISIQIGLALGIEPRALAMGVTLGSSVAFITPLGHAVNILIMGPGAYTFRDYAKVGIPLTLLAFGVILGGLALFWGLG